MPGKFETNPQATSGAAREPLRGHDRRELDPASLRRLIRQLGDPRRSNQALLALLARGDEAVPAIAEFLRSSRPSSLPEARLLAVEGLSILKGHEALDALTEVAAETLAEIPDPVVRLAEERVASRAALALAGFPGEPRAQETLFALLEKKPLIGVAEAFEKVKDSRAVPKLTEWLEEDFVAEPARRAVVACGPAGIPTLLQSLSEKHERCGSETGMSQRRRARILAILRELAVSSEIAGVEDFIEDPVQAVRWNAVRLFLEKGNAIQQQRAFRAAMEFINSPDNFTRMECEEALLTHFDLGRELVREEIHRRQLAGESESNFEPRETALAVLIRIQRKGSEEDGRRTVRKLSHNRRIRSSGLLSGDLAHTGRSGTVMGSEIMPSSRSL